jgi:hypothetical protein
VTAYAVIGYTLRITVPGEVRVSADTCERLTRRMLDAQMSDPQIFVEPFTGYHGAARLHLVAHLEQPKTGHRTLEHVTTWARYESVMTDIRQIINQLIEQCYSTSNSLSLASA